MAGQVISFDGSRCLRYNCIKEGDMFKLIFRFIYIGMLLSTLLIAFLSTPTNAQSSDTIEILTIDGTIVPVVTDYINRGITEAEEQGSTACIIVLDTPGGLLDATEEIVGRIMNAEVPVVVYVSPSGSWAASAGTFITISAHIAAMAPGTTIGAAHPVSAGQEMPEEVKKKVTEYSAAYIRSIAETRGRNPDEAELAVKESKSFTATAALENNLIDFKADNLKDLIEQMNGRRVTLANGKTVVIDTTGNLLIENDMNAVERFLHAISDPNIAYILLSLATIGLITEISNPGMIFPGVAGGICLLIAFYSLGTLNAYWAGVLLMLLALGMFIAEIFTPTFGILSAGGLASLIFGSLILFSNNPPALEVNKALIAVVSIIIAAFLVFVIGAVVRGQRRKVATGSEGIVGKVAVVQTKLDPKGTVLVNGEHWVSVINEGSAERGEEVIVTKVDGLKLEVTKKSKEG
jgi:membrane-bound serine protease (ClpP class)